MPIPFFDPWIEDSEFGYADTPIFECPECGVNIDPRHVMEDFSFFNNMCNYCVGQRQDEEDYDEEDDF